MARNRRDDDDDDDDDDLPRNKRRRQDDDDDDDDDDDEPRAAPKKVVKSDGKAIKAVFKVIGVIFGAFLLVYLVYWTYSPLGYDKELASFMPEDINTYFQMDYSSVSRLATELKTGHDNFMSGHPVANLIKGSVLKDLDVKEGDIETVAYGTSANGGWTLAMRTSEKFDSQKYYDQATKVSAKEYYERLGYKDNTDLLHDEFALKKYSSQQLGNLELCVTFPRTRVVVIASDSTVMRAILKQTWKRANINSDMLALMSRGDGHLYYANNTGSEQVGVATLTPFTGVSGADKSPTKGRIVWLASNGSQVKVGVMLEFSDSSKAADVKEQLTEKFATITKDIVQAEYKYEGLKALYPYCRPKDGGQQSGQGGKGANEPSYETDILNGAGEFICQSPFTKVSVKRAGNRVTVIGTVSVDTADKAAQKVNPFQQTFGGGGGGPPMGPPMGGGPMGPPMGGGPMGPPR